MIQVLVPKDLNSGSAQTASIDDGSMVQFVAVDQIFFSSQGRNKANVGHIAGGKDQCRFFLFEGRQFIFQLLVQIKIATDKTRTGGRSVILINGGLGCSLDSFILRQSQIIIAGEIDELLSLKGEVAGTPSVEPFQIAPLME